MPLTDISGFRANATCCVALGEGVAKATAVCVRMARWRGGCSEGDSSPIKNRREKMIAFIDNKDSFSFNIVQSLERVSGEEVKVFRAEESTVSEIEAANPSHIVVGPGPGTPTEAGISIEVIRYFAGKKPILGICLGHQAIGAAFGAKIVGAKFIRH